MIESIERARERRAGVRAAMAEVESALAAPSPGRDAAWCDDLDAALDRLGDALDAHVAVTEGPDGLLADIVRDAPRLAHRAATAKADHVALRAAVQAARAGGAVVDRRERSVELLGRLVRHRHLGADLVYEAYMVDIEAAD